jgi:flagellar basal body rod protein FlgC
MIENSEKHDNSEYFSNDLNINLELSETEKKFTKAIIKIPLIHVGENDKNVKWEAEVLRQIAPMFRGIVFKYDVNGTQGSSHVPEHLFSPFYDVGWTYEDDSGSWFDGQYLWISGEITTPEVIEKLSRIGANGKRELNAGSSGVFLNYNNVHCSICGKKPFGSCNHRRGQMYVGNKCCIVPEVVGVEKALHVALTNDPADGEAIIHDLLLQELRIGDIKMPEEKNTPKPEERVPEERVEENLETAEAGTKKSVTCPSCGHKFSVESADGGIEGIPAPTPKDKVDSVPTENTTNIRVSGENDDSTNKNRESLTKQGSLESQDSGLEKKYISRLKSSITSECKRLQRKELETADMSISQLELAEQILKTNPTPKTEKINFESQDVSGYGNVPTANVKVELADMSAAERAEKFGGSYQAMVEIFKNKVNMI